jgi:WD40 repeat protein
MDWSAKILNFESGLIACGCDDHSVKIWSLNGNKLDLKRVLPLPLPYYHTTSLVVIAVRFSPNGQYLAAVDNKCKLIVWSTANFTQIHMDQVQGKGTFYQALTWNTSSTHLAVANSSPKVNPRVRYTLSLISLAFR